MSDLAYEIEQLYIEGFGPKAIASQLGCPVELVYNWIKGIGCSEEEFDPHNTVNS